MAAAGGHYPVDEDLVDRGVALVAALQFMLYGVVVGVLGTLAICWYAGW